MDSLRLSLRVNFSAHHDIKMAGIYINPLKCAMPHKFLIAAHPAFGSCADLRV